MGILNRTPDSFYDKGATFALDDLVGPGRPVGGRRRRPARCGRREGRSRARPWRRTRSSTGSSRPSRPWWPASTSPCRSTPGGPRWPRRPTPSARWWATTSAASPTRSTCRWRRRPGPPWWPPTSGSARASPTPNRSTTTWSRRSRDYLVDRAARARAAGLAADRIVLDAGLDLGKTAAQSLTLLRASDQLASLGYPLLLSASNKTFLGVVLGLDIGQRRRGARWPPPPSGRRSAVGSCGCTTWPPTGRRAPCWPPSARPRSTAGVTVS